MHNTIKLLSKLFQNVTSRNAKYAVEKKNCKESLPCCAKRALSQIEQKSFELYDEFFLYENSEGLP